MMAPPEIREIQFLSMINVRIARHPERSEGSAFPILSKTLLLVLVLCAVRAASSQSTAKLSAPERLIVDAVDAHNSEALTLLERIVNINSGTMNFSGVRQMGDVLRPQFEALGFTTRWVDGALFHRAGHLVAEHAGAGPKILLIGPAPACSATRWPAR